MASRREGLFPRLVGSQKALTNPEAQGSGAQPAASSYVDGGAEMELFSI